MGAVEEEGGDDGLEFFSVKGKRVASSVEGWLMVGGYMYYSTGTGVRYLDL